jgi:hypothetical protein
MSRTFVIGLLVALVASIPVQAQEADGDGDAENAWLPSLALSFGIHNQGLDGDVTATTGTIPPGNGDSLISEYFQATTRLDTPLILDVPTRPRIFLTGMVQIPLAEDLVANRVDTSFDAERGPPGGQGPATNPDFIANCPDTLGPGGALSDTCSISVRNTATLDAMWGAGVGVDFTLPFDENQFHIAPAFEYYGHSMESSGRFRRTSSAAAQSDFDERTERVGNSDIYHGIGPSLNLSADVYENGPLRFSMFLEGRVIWLLTDQDLFVTVPSSDGPLTFRTEQDDLLIQAGGGVRIQWTGKR